MTKYLSDDELSGALQRAETGDQSNIQDNIASGSLEQLVPENGLEEMFEGLERVQGLSVETDPDPATLPESVDLRQYCSPVDNQGVEGTCTAHATINYLQFLMNKETGVKCNLSERFHWLNYKKYNTWVAAHALCNHWQGPEDLFPEAATKPLPGWEDSRLGTLQGPREITTIQAMKAHLASGQPICLSVGLDSNYWRGPVILADKGSQRGGHAVILAGYRDINTGGWERHGGGYFILMNSWGENFADNGFQYIAYNYFTSSKFWTSSLIFDPAVVWKPGKAPNKPDETPVDIEAVVYKKFTYKPENSREHVAYGVALRGPDTAKIVSVQYVLGDGLPTWKEQHEFEATFGTFAQKDWPAGRAEVKLDNGRTVKIPIKIP